MYFKQKVSKFYIIYIFRSVMYHTCISYVTIYEFAYQNTTRGVYHIFDNVLLHLYLDINN